MRLSPSGRISFCLISSGYDGNGDFDHLGKGIQRFSKFIFSELCHIERTIIFASKAAYVSALIKFNQTKIDKLESSYNERLDYWKTFMAEINDWKNPNRGHSLLAQIS